jgi:hypothetical protein
MLTQKIKSIISYCHTVLVESEELIGDGDGIAIIDDEETREFTRECGFKIIDYCEAHGATRDDLEKLSLKRIDIFALSKAYYGLQIKLYLKYIAKVNDRHIPILYAGLMFQLLKESGIVSLDLDYDRLITEIELSDKLETTEVISSLSGKSITQRTEINKYHNGVREILLQTMDFKRVKKAKRKRG